MASFSGTNPAGRVPVLVQNLSGSVNRTGGTRNLVVQESLAKVQAKDQEIGDLRAGHEPPS